MASGEFSGTKAATATDGTEMNARGQWNGFRSVLCPIDFSATSKRALQGAATLATRAKAGLVVLYVVDPLLVAAAEVESRDRRFLQKCRHALARFVQTGVPAGMLRRGRVRWHVSLGSASDEILKAAQRADLIVMGTHGLTGAVRVIAGSTTLDVLGRTSLPVLAIPPADEGGRAKRLRFSSGWIVAAIDLDGHASRHVAAAVTVATWLSASLLLVHVVKRLDAPPAVTTALSAHRRTQLATAKRELERLVAQARRRVKADSCVLRGHPADEIAALVAATRSNLLMTTLRDGRGWFGSRRGAVSYHVLSHASAPVLACPPQWQPR